MDSIRNRMMDVYGYETGPYEGYIHETNNDKLIAKLDWNINPSNVLTLPVQLSGRQARPAAAPVRAQLRQHRPRAEREQPAVPELGLRHQQQPQFLRAGAQQPVEQLRQPVLRELQPVPRLPQPFSVDFPDHRDRRGRRHVHHRRPRAVLDPQHPRPGRLAAHQQLYLVPRPALLHARRQLRDVRLLQLVQHLPARRVLPARRSTFIGQHVLVAGRVLRRDRSEQSRISSTSNSYVGAGPFKGENIDVGQLGFYVQDEFLVSERLNLTAGLRVDFPMYFTDPVDNPFSRGLTALDENGQPETVDQSSLPGCQAAVLPADRLQLERGRGSATRRSAAAPASSRDGFRSSGSAT